MLTMDVRLLYFYNFLKIISDNKGIELFNYYKNIYLVDLDERFQKLLDEKIQTMLVQEFKEDNTIEVINTKSLFQEKIQDQERMLCHN